MTSFNCIDPYQFIKPLLFKLDAEKAHELTLDLASKWPLILSYFYERNWTDSSSLKVGRLRWPTPFGLAAGLDKNAQALDFFCRLSFGAIEVGTVTPRPQPGNAKPRLWRYPDLLALRNQMGFNNHGPMVMKEHLLRAGRQGKIIGVNIGKNKDTTQDKAIEDYLVLYQALAPFCDYLVINVSSPNTQGLRSLQEKDFLNDLFLALKPMRQKCDKDLYLKMAPDLEKNQVQEICQMCKEHKLAGVVATNTTIDATLGPGGVSGKPLYPKASLVRSWALESLKEAALDVIAVGGFSSFDQVFNYWAQGGKAIQIYTAFIYQGPRLINHLVDQSHKLCEILGLKSIEELIINARDIDISTPSIEKVINGEKSFCF